MIMANVGLTLTCRAASLRNDASASSSRPRRWSHQGDSGAKTSPEQMTTGHTHCIANGKLIRECQQVALVS